MRVTVRVPATSANLGPGFDCFALALDLCNEVTVDTDADPGVTWEGEGAGELPTDGSDLISRAIASAVERLRSVWEMSDAAVPAFALHGINRIPLARGLGSSAAAAVAGVRIAYALVGLDGTDHRADVIHPAGHLDGHYDNVAAATVGGFTIVAEGTVHRFDPHPDVQVAIVVPRHLRLPTDRARNAVADPIRLSRAVANIGTASVLAIGLTQRPSLIMHALADRIHEDARRALVPEVGAMYRRISEANVPVCLSGSGPSLLAFELEDSGEVPDDLGPDWEVWRPGIRYDGVEVAVG